MGKMAKRIMILAIALVFAVGFFGLIDLCCVAESPPPPVAPPLPLPPPHRDQLQVLWVRSLDAPEGMIDVIAKVKNPNTAWGAKNMLVTWSFKGFDGTTLVSHEERSYMLPREEKFLISRFGKPTQPIKNITLDVKVSDNDWEELVDFIQLDLDSTDVYLDSAKKFPQFTAHMSAIIHNRSLFGLQDIKVRALLFDKTGTLIAVNTSVVQTVLAGEKRQVDMFWVIPLTIQDVSRKVVVAYSNVLENSNFVQQYGGEFVRERTLSRQFEEPQRFFRLPGIFEWIRVPWW